MVHLLSPHIQTPSDLSLHVVAVRASGDRLDLSFELHGDLDAVIVPQPAPPERSIGLWQHTCFEAFVAAGGGESYYEINLSPSGRWAAYRFDGYRSGMTDALDEPPATSLLREMGKLVLVASVSGLPESPWRVGLSAVIETMDGTMSYWALRHPAGKPDFHHRDCFALDLAAPARP